MPDDRPVSPEEHDERESAYANGYEHGRRDEREAAIEAGVFRFGAYATPAALSTPAGPSPETLFQDGVRQGRAIAERSARRAREEAVEALREALVRTRNALHRACLGLQSTEGFRDDFAAANAALSAARPSSPEPSCAECKDTGRWYGSVGDDAPRERSRCPACGRPSSPTPEETP